jgi:protein SCO1/2
MRGGFVHRRPSANLKRCALLLSVLAVFSMLTNARAQRGGGFYSRPAEDNAQRAGVTPDTLKDVGIDQHLNEQVPLDAVFHDEDGRTIKLGDYFNKGQPVLLALVYYECPMLCNQVLNGVLNSVRNVPFNVGEQYQIVVVSFDAREDKNRELAKEKKKTYLHYYLQDGARPAEKARAGWHFLTGEQAEIDKLANAVGFKYKYDPQSEQFAHASGIMIATPEGKLSRYFYGIAYEPKDLRFGLIDASQNKIGSTADKILLYCYHYDPRTGKYGAVVMNMLKIGGVITIFGIATLIIGLSLGTRFFRKRKDAAPVSQARV